MDLVFEWDQSKSRSNRKKHGVTFEEARSAFRDPAARVVFDAEHGEIEDRFVLLGLSETARVIVVCHCYRHRESVIRIISARCATASERGQYGQLSL